MVLKTLMKRLLKEEQAGLRQPRRNVEALRDQQQQETTTTPRPYGTRGGNSITGASVSWNPGKKAHAVGDVDTEGCSHYQESGPKQRGGQGKQFLISVSSYLPIYCQRFPLANLNWKPEAKGAQTMVSHTEWNRVRKGGDKYGWIDREWPG